MKKAYHGTQLQKQYIAEYYADMDALGVARADIEPKATEHILEMIAVVRGLIEKRVRSYECKRVKTEVSISRWINSAGMESFRRKSWMTCFHKASGNMWMSEKRSPADFGRSGRLRRRRAMVGEPVGKGSRMA